VERAAAARDGERSGFAIEVGRAAGGALVFAIPCLMTQEFWSLGARMDPFRLALLCVLMLPLLVRLSRYGGLRQTDRLSDDIADALVSVAVAAAAAALILWLFGEIGPGQSTREAIGKVALQTVPASLGAILALNQFGGQPAETERARAESTYSGELFLMVVGALFLSLNIAPTEEVMLLALRMSAWQTLGLMAVSLVAMHAFVYSLEFRGSHPVGPGDRLLGLFARYTVVGYVLVLAVSLYVVWTFGHVEAVAAEDLLGTAVVLGLPAGIGAAAARLIL
jgi:putative integral membrane protein (TIGR02587 family)